MNWTISTTPDAGQTWTHVEDFSGSQEEGMARVRALQDETPGRYRLAPAEAPASQPAPTAPGGATPSS